MSGTERWICPCGAELVVVRDQKRPERVWRTLRSANSAISQWDRSGGLWWHYHFDGVDKGFHEATLKREPVVLTAAS